LVKEVEATLRTGKELACYIQNLSYKDLPINVIHQAKRVVLDSLGTILMGVRKEEAHPIVKFLQKLEEKNECTVIKSNLKTSCPWSAFANSSYAQVHDCNDGHRDSAAFGGAAHPGRTAIPTALAVGEKLSSTGKEVITSLVVGYDVATKIRGMDNRPPAATYSSAAIAAHLMDLEIDKIQFALGIAGFIAPKGFPSNLSYDTNFLRTGYQAKNGIEAAYFAKEGLIGPPMGDDRRLSTRFNDRGLGSEFEILNVYIKPWPTCRMTHGAIEAIIKIKNDTKIDLEKIKEINVHQLTHGMYIKDSPVDVDSYYKTCQFNLSYIVAVTLMDGEVTENQFTKERIADKATHDLAKKVKIIADESLDAIYPDVYRPTTVEIILKNGKSYTKTVQNPFGDPRNTLDDDALYKKFVKWSGPSLTEDEALAIKDIVWRLENLDNINDLMELIRS
jgi:2-methylcitrate dehydratase PrpD